MSRIQITRLIIYSASLFSGLFLICSIGLSRRSSSHFSEQTTEKDNKYLLTMFSCFKEGVIYPHHKFVHNYVISSWKNLSLQFRQILFTTNISSNLSQAAASAGWDVVKVNRSLPSGATYLKDMYNYAFNNYNSVFYAFINGDILFDDSLLMTLKSVEERRKSLNNNILIIGRRLNYVFKEYGKPELLEKENLKNLATKGTLFATCAEDFFVFTPPPENAFKWDKIADVVVGRLAYDNYLVSIANTYKVNTIDATNTLLAFHVSHPKVLDTGRQNADASVNNRIIGPFDFWTGLTTNAKFKTDYDAKGKIVLVKR